MDLIDSETLIEDSTPDAPELYYQFWQFWLMILSLGPSIKDVSSEGEGGGYEKLQIGETFKA